MIEKLGMQGYEAISTPSEHVKFVLDNLIIREREREALHIAEIGIGIGATTLEILKRLSDKDFYYMFDFQKTVDELFEDIKDSKCSIKKYGNTSKLWDSYCWTLADFYLNEMSSKNIFDLAYLDGAHTLFHDAPACCVLKELVKVGGYLILDDVKWSYARSPTMNPKIYPVILEKMTDEQINIPHIELILKLFLDTDKRFVRFYDESLSDLRAIYKKIE